MGFNDPQQTTHPQTEVTTEIVFLPPARVQAAAYKVSVPFRPGFCLVTSAVWIMQDIPIDLTRACGLIRVGKVEQAGDSQDSVQWL